MTRTLNRPVRRTVAASVAALALLSLSACGGDDEKSAGDDTSSSSASATTSPSGSTSESASESPSESGDSGGGAQGGTEISAEEFGSIVKQALDQATTANATTSNSASGLDATGQVDYTGKTPAVKMKATVAQLGDIDLVLVDNVMYLKTAAFGDKYVKLPLDDPNNPLGSLADSLDPTAAFQKLVDGITVATFVGPEDVDGEQLDHYATTVESKVLLQDLPAGAQGQAQLPDTIDYQWWFDGDGFIRKFSADLGTTAGTVDGTFSDWGTKVDIQAPPESETTTMPAGMG